MLTATRIDDADGQDLHDKTIVFGKTGVDTDSDIPWLQSLALHNFLQRLHHVLQPFGLIGRACQQH